MATTAASGAETVAAAPASQNSEQLFEAARARRRLRLQALAHVLFVVVALVVGFVLIKLGIPKYATKQPMNFELIWLGLGVGVGAIFSWLLPYLVADRRSAPYVFVSPFFILFAAFGLFPILFSLYLSFNIWEPASGFVGIKFAGWDHLQTSWLSWLPIPGNYTYAAGDKLFGISAWNTLFIAVASGLPQHLVGMPLAYFFEVAYKKFRNVITGAYFLPFITSSVAISLIFNTLFSQHFGAINAFLDALSNLPLVGHYIPHGQEGHINWLNKAVNVKPAISFVVWWRYVGWNTVLYLSALQAISKELFEAAEMDGATRWQTFSRVVVPLLRPMMFFAITLTIIGNLQLFEEPFILVGPNGGVEQSGMTSAMFMYKYGFDYSGEFGTACAISWMLFIVIALLTMVNQRIFSRRGQEGVA
jgi:multiple sugar transport system permease protein